MTEVVAALICRKRDARTEFLICQRPEHKARGLLWEFVGGKVEPGEEPEEALERECREELDVDVAVGEPFTEVCHTYPDLHIRLTVFYAFLLRGEPKLLEHHDLRWIVPEEIPQFAFCPADEAILQKIREETLEPLFLTDVQQRLFSQRDHRYRKFQCRLMPTVPVETVIGVRTPLLRAYAKELFKTPQADAFLQCLPHHYYEEDNLHAYLLEQISSYSRLIAEVDRFLPFINNWATCDGLSTRIFRKHHGELRRDVDRWIASKEPYAVRFGIKILMNEFLDADFSPRDAQQVAGVRREEYYIRMMQAWYFATALAKRYDDVVGFLQNGKLDPWVLRMTIRKATESDRIPESRKQELRVMSDACKK